MAKGPRSRIQDYNSMSLQDLTFELRCRGASFPRALGRVDGYRIVPV
jgi:hypothetical protein